MKKHNDDENFLFKFSKHAGVYGVYALDQIYPMADDYDFEIGCHWDGEGTTDPDTLYEWLLDYHEDDQEKIDTMKELYEIDDHLSDYEKFNILKDMPSNIIPDELYFYNYEDRYTLVSVALCYQDAIEIKKSISEDRRPYFERISRRQIEGYSYLNDIVLLLEKLARNI